MSRTALTPPRPAMSRLLARILLPCLAGCHGGHAELGDAVGLLQVASEEAPANASVAAANASVTAPKGFAHVMHRWIEPLLGFQGYKTTKAADGTLTTARQLMEASTESVEVITGAVDQVIAFWETIEKGVQPALNRFADYKNESGGTDAMGLVDSQADVVLAYLHWMVEAEAAIGEASRRVMSFYENEAPEAVRKNYQAVKPDVDDVLAECKLARMPLEKVLAYYWMAKHYNIAPQARLKHATETIKGLVSNMTDGHTSGRIKDQRDAQLREVENAVYRQNADRAWGRASKKMINRLFALDLLMSKVWLSLGVGIAPEAPKQARAEAA